MDNIFLVPGTGAFQNAHLHLLKSYLRRNIKAKIHKFTYASLVNPIETSAEELLDFVMHKQSKATDTNHFIGYSQGGVICLQLLSKLKERPFKLGNVVTLAAPSEGSHLAEAIRHTMLYQWITGIPGQQLAHTYDPFVNHYGEIDFNVLDIRGNAGPLGGWFDTLPLGEAINDWIKRKHAKRFFDGKDNDGLMSVDKLNVKEKDNGQVYSKQANANHIGILLPGKHFKLITNFILHGHPMQ